MSSDNITPPQISEERLRELKTQAFNAVMHGADRDEDDLLAELVATEINRQWLERLEPVAGVGDLILTVRERAMAAGALNRATLYRIKEQG